MYEAVFDSENRWWQPKWEQADAIAWLMILEQKANMLLNYIGSMTMNDLCWHIGLPQTAEGAVMGWEADPNPKVKKIRFDLDPFDAKQIGIRLQPEKVLWRIDSTQM